MPMHISVTLASRSVIGSIKVNVSLITCVYNLRYYLGGLSVSKKLNHTIRGILLLIGILLLAVPGSAAYAYTSPYFATRFENSGPMGDQATQIIARGNTLYASFYGTCNIYKIVNEVVVQNVAGIRGICGYEPDGSIASQNRINSPSSIDVGPDGTVYFTEPYSHLVRAVLPNGQLTTIAGNGSIAPDPSNRVDTADARQTPFNSPTHVKVGPDGAIYVYDEGVLRRILPDGSTDHVIGEFASSGSHNPYIEGGVANQHNFPEGDFSSTINGASPCQVDFDATTNLFIQCSARLYKVDHTDNTIHTYSTPPVNPVLTLEDAPLSTVRFGFGILDIDSQGRIWNGGGGLSTGIGIQYITPSDNIVRTAAGGGNDENASTASSSAIPGSSLRLPYLTSISVDNGHIYYVSRYTQPNGFPASYIGKLSIIQDSTPPVLQSHLSPVPNTAGWINSTGTLTWNVTDSESPILNQTNCNPTTISTDTGGTTYTCAATSVGGSNSQSITVRRDTVAPTASVPTISGGVDLNILGLGYVFLANTTTISAVVSDSLSGIAAAEYYFDTDPGQGHGTAMTISGNTATATASLVGLNGQHILHVRALDAASNWSTVANRTFTRIGS